MDSLEQLKNHLTALNAECDQAQAMIDEGRTRFADDSFVQKTLDAQQMWLDQQRDSIKRVREYLDNRNEY